MNKIDFKNLPDTSTPLSASNLNTMQNNIETAINTNATYSTDEVVVGTFMGKPLYRKVYESTSYSTLITLPISNIDKITNISGMIERSDYDIWQLIPSRIDNASFSAQFGNLQYTSSAVSIYLSFGTSWSSNFSRIIIAIEYTKTTD